MGSKTHQYQGLPPTATAYEAVEDIEQDASAHFDRDVYLRLFPAAAAGVQQAGHFDDLSAEKASRRRQPGTQGIEEARGQRFYPERYSAYVGLVALGMLLLLSWSSATDAFASQSVHGATILTALKTLAVLVVAFSVVYRGRG